MSNTDNPEKCQICKGFGWIRARLVSRDEETCLSCNGTGKVDTPKPEKPIAPLDIELWHDREWAIGNKINEVIATMAALSPQAEPKPATSDDAIPTPAPTQEKPNPATDIDEILDNNAVELVDYVIGGELKGKVTRVKPHAKQAIQHLITQAEERGKREGEYNAFGAASTWVTKYPEADKLWHEMLLAELKGEQL